MAIKVMLAEDMHMVRGAPVALECPLTTPELDVPRLAASGVEAAELASRLFLSTGTLRNYPSTIASRLHARNRVDVIHIATDAVWI